MATRVRKDIWDLGDEANPWKDPAILAYAKAVGAMKKVDSTNPSSGASWINQAAIHAVNGASVPGRLETQCQHGGWFFFPWHRMYLLRFEQILRSHMPAATAATWALPYWNYSDVAARRKLPPAFRATKLPDGTANPLFTSQRRSIYNNGTQGLPEPATRTTAALAETVFTRTTGGTTSGFGGGVTGFHHGASGPWGPLEGTPHGAVHSEIGGFMGGFGTAGLDPIFWLHHCNIDRLWEVWLRKPPPGQTHTNPVRDSRWRTMTFELIDKTGARKKRPVSDFLDIEGQLGYTYSGIPQRVTVPSPSELNEILESDDVSDDEQPAELVGATEASVTLAGTTAATSLAVSQPTGPAARTDESLAPPPRVYLNVENIEGEKNPGVLYGVFVNLPEGEVPDPDGAHYAGLMPMFGIEVTAQDDDEQEEASHGLRYAFDITELAQTLTEQGHWDPANLHVTFSPIGNEDEIAGDEPVAPVTIGRVSLFMQ